MVEQSRLEDSWAPWAPLQRELWNVWAKALAGDRPASPWKQASANPLEIGADLLKRCFRIQADCMGAALGSRDPGAPFQKLAGQHLETMQAMMEGWLELQGKAYSSWVGAMSQFDPIRCTSPDRFFAAAKDWMLACGKLAEQSAECQARFMSAAMPSGEGAPSSSAPQPRKEKQRVSAAAVA